MLYRKQWAVIAVCAMAALIGGCGGSSGMVSLDARPAAVSSNAVEIEFVQPVEGDGLRQQVDYNYDYSSFSASEGFAVVPMATEQAPDYGRPDVFTMQITHEGADRKVSLACTGADSPLLHFRYDPTTWLIAGVGVLNPFVTEGYVTFVDILEPGLLAINAAPAGVESAPLKTGRYAEIHIQPRGIERSVSTAPEGLASISAAFYCEGDSPLSPLSYGNINFRLDGEFGDKDATAKDGTLTGSELTRFAYDVNTHDVELTNFGQTYGWDNGFNAYSAMVLSWTERLTGDYDNNGLVNVFDLQPVGMFFDGPPEIFGEPTPTQWAQGHTIDTSDSSYYTFFAMMADIDWLDDMFHVVDSYYILDQADKPLTANYTFDNTSYGGTPAHGLTDVKNGLDGFFDRGGPHA